MSKHLTVIPAVHLFLVNTENQLLLSRRYNTGYEDGNYSVVAGHVEPGETLLQSMQREALEEAGIVIDENDFTFIHVMYRQKENNSVLNRIDYFFKCTNWQGTPTIMEADKCDDLKWVSFDDIPVNTIEYIKSAIEKYKSNNCFSEFGWGERL